MDATTIKAQRQLGGVSAAKSTKSKRKKKRSPLQSAGQSSGPGDGAESLEKSKRRQSYRGDVSSSDAGTEGKCTCTSFTLGALHLIDAGLGLACMAYGGMVHVVNVTAVAVAYGMVLFIGAVSGAMGYFFGCCDRRGLTGSAVAGLLACLADIAAFVFVILSWGTFIQFLKDNSEALLLTDSAISCIQSLQILFAVIFIVLAGLEGSR